MLIKKKARGKRRESAAQKKGGAEKEREDTEAGAGQPPLPSIANWRARLPSPCALRGDRRARQRRQAYAVERGVDAQDGVVGGKVPHPPPGGRAHLHKVGERRPEVRDRQTLHRLELLGGAEVVEALLCCVVLCCGCVVHYGPYTLFSTFQYWLNSFFKCFQNHVVGLGWVGLGWVNNVVLCFVTRRPTVATALGERRSPPKVWAERGGGS